MEFIRKVSQKHAPFIKHTNEENAISWFKEMLKYHARNMKWS